MRTRALVVALLAALPVAVAAQDGIWRAGAVGEPALTYLAGEWQAHLREASPNERAYCITVASHGHLRDDKRSDVSIVRVVVTPDSVEGVTPWSINRVLCPSGTLALMHSHPVGDCNPSRTDYRSLRRSGNPFAVVQCGVVHYRFYYPDELGGRRRLSPWVYAGALGGVIAVNAAFHLDTDPGVGADPWSSPDKLVHFALGGVITALATEARVRPVVAAGGLCMAAVGYEASQGYVSRKDIVAGCAGAAVAYAWTRLWR